MMYMIRGRLVSNKNVVSCRWIFFYRQRAKWLRCVYRLFPLQQPTTAGFFEHMEQTFVSRGVGIICFEVIVVTNEVFLLNELRFVQASLRDCPNAVNVSKNSSKVTTTTLKQRITPPKRVFASFVSFRPFISLEKNSFLGRGMNGLQ